jgi:predicted RNA-binding Zn-ribbon protein involved in translation (DUF1610 family)
LNTGKVVAALNYEFPCSACRKPIKYSASKCPYCGHVVSSVNIAARPSGSDFDGKALMGCIGVPALIAFGVYIVISAGPNEEERRASDFTFAQEYEFKERNARFACSEKGVATACGEIEANAELARYYRQRVSEADNR